MSKRSETIKPPNLSTENTKANKYAADTERIAKLIGNHAASGHKAAYEEYCNLLHRATAKGRVVTPARVRELYPIIRNISEEIDEIKSEEEVMDTYYKACEKIAEALAVLHQYREFIPVECFNPDALAKWLTQSSWARTSDFIEESGSLLIGGLIEKQWFDKSRAKA